MREFGPTASPQLQQQIRQLAAELFAGVPAKRPLRGGDFAMDDEAAVVVYEATIQVDDTQRLRIAQTVPEARPPFEWLLEITSDIGESDYFKHYLIREHDIMLAQRKELTPIDDQEAHVILRDLQTARVAL